MIGNDTANEVWIRVAQSGHEFGQLLFVELADRAEHAFLGALAECRIVGAFGHRHAHNFSCSASNTQTNRDTLY